jgi:WD40 repeat protein/serine/threonine protein kinase
MAGCAGRELLERFLGCNLGAAESDNIASHVEGCRACQEILEQLASETPGLPHPSSPTEPDDPEPSPEFLERLHRILLDTTPPDVVPFGRTRAGGRKGDGLGAHRCRDGDWAPPATVPGYEVIAELSRGGMGVVYRARQVGLNRMVALKMILAGAGAGAEDRARFRAEAEAVARLHHPNIVQIYDIGECDGCPYFSMELVDGPTLAAACQGRPQPARPAAAIVETLARAIDCAHQRGIIHRDLKPANVLLQPMIARAAWRPSGVDGHRDHTSSSLSSSFWTPKLADFGLARRLDDLSLTQHGRILGTPSYMAPEQVDTKGRRPGPAVDVYSLGAILYEMLTGRPPFLAGSIKSTLALVASEDPIPTRRLRPDVPRDLETIALKCMEKSPARRYASAADLADDLGRFLRGEPILARAPSRLDRWVKFSRRHAAAVGGVAAVIVALALGIASTSVMALREARARRQANHSADIARDSAREAGAARTAARREAYQARLAAAMAAMGHTDIREAAHQLDAAPGELRGWEWRHLQGRLDQSLAVVAGLPAAVPVAFCPPGQRLAVADPQGYRLLDAVTGTCLALRATDAPTHQVFAFMTSRGSRFVFDQSDDTLSLALTDADGRALGRIALPQQPRPAEKPPFLVMAMSPDGSRLALQALQYGQSPLIEVFDTASGRRTAAGGHLGARLCSLEFSPDGRRLAAVIADSNQVFVFDAATMERVTTLSGHVGAVAGVAYSRDGGRLASCGEDQTIRLWDAGTGGMVEVLRGHSGRVQCVTFSLDGRAIASGGVDGTIRLWRPGGEGAVLVRHGHTAAVIRVAFGADGRTIASLGDDGTARLWDTIAPDDASVLRGHTSYVYPVAFSPDGRRIASGSWDRTVRLWDADSGESSHILRGHDRPVGALAFTADGTRLASWGEDCTIRLWDITTGAEIEPRLTHECMGERDSVYSLVVGPDGQRIGAVTAGGLRFWDAATGAELAPLRLPIRGVRVAAFSPDGTRLAAGGDEPRVVIVDAASGALVAELSGFEGRIQALAFSPDGRHVLTAGQDPTLRLWEAATGRLVRSFAGHDQEVLTAIFHPDGSRIASGGHDQSIRIWDVETGDELVRLPGHSWYVFSLAFSPDGQTLVSGSGDSTVRLWDAFPVARRLRARRVVGNTTGRIDHPSLRPDPSNIPK